jgi:hypothetical protein
MLGGTTMLMKVCAAAAIALGCLLTVPSASFAQGQDKGKSATTQHKKAKNGHSDTVHENAGHRPKKGHADEVHQK